MLTGKVLRQFTHKGKQYNEGDEITLKPHVAGKYERAGRIGLKKMDVKVVDEANEKLAVKIDKAQTEALKSSAPATNVKSTGSKTVATKKGK